MDLTIERFDLNEEVREPNTRRETPADAPFPTDFPFIVDDDTQEVVEPLALHLANKFANDGCFKGTQWTKANSAGAAASEGASRNRKLSHPPMTPSPTMEWSTDSSSRLTTHAPSTALAPPPPFGLYTVPLLMPESQAISVGIAGVAGYAFSTPSASTRTPGEQGSTLVNQIMSSRA